MKKYIICTLLTLVACKTENKKDIWSTEKTETKHSKKREKEVWGKVLRGHHPELFYGTPVYNTAIAIKNKDNEALKKEISKLSKQEVNYQDTKFKTTLGHFALQHENLEAIKLLIDKELNPNIISDNGYCIMTNINTPHNSRLPNSLETLKYIIKNGGNVNLLNLKDVFNVSPLITASGSNIINTKLLIESGADPNFIYKNTDRGGSFYDRSALLKALLYKRIDIVNYLIFEQKVDYKIYKYPLDSKYYPEGYRVLGALKDMTFSLDSEKHKKKMKLVNYLSEQGLDYWSVPVPKHIKENLNYNTEEYLSKY